MGLRTRARWRKRVPLLRTWSSEWNEPPHPATDRDEKAVVQPLGSAKEDENEPSVRWQTLADNIPQLAWIADASGWIYWYNKRWYDHTGT
jgi:PAS domain-containing protein